MKELSCIIVDDESSSRNVLKALLKMYCPQVDVLSEASNITDAYAKIIDLQPAIVFLDIQMPGGNGISLLKKFSEIPFQVIFVTSYDKYAIEAVKFSALYYLMKPIEVESLMEAVQKIERTIITKETYKQQVFNVIFNMESLGLEKKIALHDYDSVIFISVNDILYLEGNENYTFVRTNEKKISSSKNLGKFEEMLSNFPQFFRINRGCIINLNYLDQYSKGEPCILTIAGKWNFEISRRRKKDFLERMKGE